MNRAIALTLFLVSLIVALTIIVAYAVTVFAPRSEREQHDRKAKEIWPPAISPARNRPCEAIEAIRSAVEESRKGSQEVRYPLDAAAIHAACYEFRLAEGKYPENWLAEGVTNYKRLANDWAEFDLQKTKEVETWKEQNKPDDYRIRRMTDPAFKPPPGSVDSSILCESIELAPAIPKTSSTLPQGIVVEHVFWRKTLKLAISNNQVIWFSSKALTLDDIQVDDEIRATVSPAPPNKPNPLKINFDEEKKGEIKILPAQNITDYFVPGDVTLNFELTDLRGPEYSSTAVWLVKCRRPN